MTQEKKKREKKKQAIGVSINKETLDRVKKQAAKELRPLSNFVEVAIVKYLDSVEEKAE